MFGWAMVSYIPKPVDNIAPPWIRQDNLKYVNEDAQIACVHPKLDALKSNGFPVK